MNPANTQDPREHLRSNVFLSAALGHGRDSRPVRIRNVSAMGALVDGKNLPNEGASVRLRRGGLCAGGEVVWQSEGQCGIRFHNCIDVEPWLTRIGHSGQCRVDNLVEALRSGNAPSGQVERAPGGGIEEISAELTRINEDLGNLPDLTIELAEELLRIDAVAQRLRDWVANEG